MVRRRKREQRVKAIAHSSSLPWFDQPPYQTSEPREKVEWRITSGAIHAKVPATVMCVVLPKRRARPKSAIFMVLACSSALPSAPTCGKDKGEMEVSAFF